MRNCREIPVCGRAGRPPLYDRLLVPRRYRMQATYGIAVRAPGSKLPGPGCRFVDEPGRVAQAFRGIVLTKYQHQKVFEFF